MTKCIISHRRCSIKKIVVLKISQNLQETRVLKSLFNKVAGLLAIKKRLRHRCFHVKLVKF